MLIALGSPEVFSEWGYLTFLSTVSLKRIIKKNPLEFKHFPRNSRKLKFQSYNTKYFKDVQ